MSSLPTVAKMQTYIKHLYRGTQSIDISKISLLKVFPPEYSKYQNCHKTNGNTSLEAYILTDNNPIAAIFYNSKIGRIDLVDVRPEYRYQGIATYLVNEVSNEAKKNNIDKIYVFANKQHYLYNKLIEKGYLYEGIDDKNIGIFYKTF